MKPSAPIQYSKLEKEILLATDKIFASNPLISELLAKLSTAGRVVVFGGFVRDRIHNYVHGDSLPSRDIDLVISGTLPDSVHDAVKNNFDGYRRQLSKDLKVDYWELHRTYAFRAGLFEPKLESLPLTTVYTVNGCFLDIAGARLIEHHAIEHIAGKKISFNCMGYLNKFPQYQAFRAMDLAQRMGYQLDQDVHAFVRTQIEQTALDQFAAAVQQHRPEMATEQIGELCRRYS